MRYSKLAVSGLFIFCLVQLSGCSFISSSHRDTDGPPSMDLDASMVPDAVPKNEPYHPYHNGSRDYVVGGKRYHVLKSAKGYVKEGYASWYGSKFHGGPTSTQERYNLYSMTAANTELPLPTYVQVTNLRNGKQVIVRVNDRGPFHSKRIIDLSYMAAKKLDFVDSGIARVRVVAIDPNTWNKNNNKNNINNNKDNNIENEKNKKIYLQAGAFIALENAEKLSTKIEQIIDKPVRIDHSDNMYRVRIGPISCDSKRDKIKQLLEKNGINKIAVVNI
jgi:rare lipoprotein A